jgi:hypothetical protein
MFICFWTATMLKQPAEDFGIPHTSKVGISLEEEKRRVATFRRRKNDLTSNSPPCK